VTVLVRRAGKEGREARVALVHLEGGAVMEAMERLARKAGMADRVERGARQGPLLQGGVSYGRGRWRRRLLRRRLLEVSVFFSIAVGNSDAIAVAIVHVFVQFHVMLCDVFVQFHVMLCDVNLCGSMHEA
jgi:hypothetical protein